MTNEEELRYVTQSVRRIRNARNMSQLELSARANLSQSFLANIETGKKEPSALTLIRIARALDVSPRDFFPEADSPGASATREGIKAEIASLLALL